MSIPHTTDQEEHAQASADQESAKKEVAPTDKRLRQNPEFSDLRQYLATHDLIDHRHLAKLLQRPITSENVGLVQFLTQTGLVTTEEMQEAKAKKRQEPDISLEVALRQLGILGDETWAMVLSVISGFPYLAFETEVVETKAVRRLERRSAITWNAFPIRFDGDTLILAIADPRGVDLDELAHFVDCKIQPALASVFRIRTAIIHWYGESRKVEHSLLLEELDLRGVAPMAKGEKISVHMDVVTLINRIIVTAANLKASDIHIIPDERFVRIQLRLDGKIHSWMRLPLGLHNQMVSRLKVLAGMDIAERRLPQDGNIRTRLADRVADIRISDIPAVRGEAMVLRLLDLQVGLVKLPDLGFFPEDYARLQQTIALPYGLVLLTGPTGSGKSTTLRAALDYMLQQEMRHILTVEDPVEVKMEGVTQILVNDKIGYTFAKALRHFLRHDPDVIMVGEIRDTETARIAVQAALTGHLVLSTLHTNDAPGAIARLIDMGVEPFLVSSALTMVIAQRLVRRLCRHCCQAQPPDEKSIALLANMGYSGGVKPIYQAVGCAQCNDTGFKGRTVIYEMLSIHETLKSMTARRESAQALRNTARKHGFQPLSSCGLRKVLLGETSLAEVAGYLDTLPEVV